MPDQKTKQELDLNYYSVYADALPGVPRYVNPDFHMRWREVDTIVRAIKTHRARMVDVTAALGITRHALRRKLVKFGIPKLEAWRDAVTDKARINLGNAAFLKERPPDSGAVVGGDSGAAQPSTLIPPLPEPVPGPRLVGK